MNYTHININPDALTWARKRARHSVESLARKVGASPKVVQAWEDGARKPTLKQLFALVESLYQPVQFYMADKFPKVPEVLSARPKSLKLRILSLCNCFFIVKKS